MTNEINDMKDVLKATINSLIDTQEITEKNLLIRALTYREANNYEPRSPILHSKIRLGNTAPSSEENLGRDVNQTYVHSSGANSESCTFDNYIGMYGVSKEKNVDEIDNVTGETTDKTSEEISFQEIYTQWVVLHRKYLSRRYITSGLCYIGNSRKRKK